MPKNATTARRSRGKIEVLELSAKCLNVGLAPTGGWRATLAINIQLEGPDGQKYRGAGSRLHVRVYPIRPEGGERSASATNGRAPRKSKAGGGRKARSKG